MSAVYSESDVTQFEMELEAKLCDVVRQTRENMDVAAVEVDLVSGLPDESKPPLRRKRRRHEDGHQPDVYLPPCRICGDESSGFHYGANTCEACKGFFRRTLKKENKIYRCKCTAKEKSESKEGDPITNGCPSCRYKQCIKVGMSKQAIKIGRYTSVHRTQNITEIKSRSNNQSRPINQKQSDDKLELSKDSDISSPGSVGDTTYLGPGLNSPEEICRLGNQSPFETVYGYTNEAEVKSTNNFMQEEIYDVIERLSEAHSSTLFKYNTQPKESIQKFHQEYLEIYKRKNELFGTMGALSKDEYLEFYNITGIDLDDRRTNFEQFIQEFQHKIRNIIRFSKSIPGFTDLSQNDQINLIKHSRAETFVVTGYQNICKYVSMELRVMTLPWNQTAHFEEGNMIFPEILTSKKAEYSRRLDDLHLDQKEQALLRAIVMTFPDRCVLEDPNAVQKIQLKLFHCLQHKLENRSCGGRKLLYKLFDVLISFRDLTEIDNSVIKELLFEYKTQENMNWVDDLIM